MPPEPLDNPREAPSRILLLAALTALAFLLLILGFARLQIFHVGELQERTDRQNLRRILLPPPRGNILDRDGRPLVVNRPLYAAALYLNDLRPEFRREYILLVRQARHQGQSPNRSHLQQTARLNVAQRYLDHLDHILATSTPPLTSAALERHFRQYLLLPFPLQEDLAPAQFAQLLDKLPTSSPIQLLTSTTRHYPHGNLAAHLLGYTGPDPQSAAGADLQADLITFADQATIGRAGLELQYDPLLRGTPGHETWKVDPAGFTTERVNLTPPTPGQDLITSIDLDLQAAAEFSLSGHTGAAVVLHVPTGEVLALASRPAYDPNLLVPRIPQSVFDDIRQRGAWLNRAHQGLYPPGSTFKVITTLAALRTGTISSNTVHTCPGYHTVGNRHFLCHYRPGHGPQSLEQALRNSCNVFFYITGLATGIDALADEAQRFHLHQPTGIDLPAEASRMIVPTRQYKRDRTGQPWYPGDTANTAIGQGYLLVTPLQMAALTASIARGQTRTLPSLRKLHSPPQHHASPIALAPQQLARLRQGMHLAADSGTARLIRIPNLPAAAKTGTAQIWVDGEETTLAWFIGYAPLDNPQIALSILIEGTDPNDNFHGGSTAAPVARAILATWLRKQATPNTQANAHP